MKGWRALKNLEILRNDHWSNFGRGLGKSAAPWVRRYGDNWQKHLAEAVLSGKKTYSGLRVPQSIRKSDAELYLRRATSVAGKPYRDGKGTKPELITHVERRVSQLRNQQFQQEVLKRLRKPKRNIRLDIEEYTRREGRKRKAASGAYSRALDSRLKADKEQRISHTEIRKRAKAEKERDNFIRELIPAKLVEQAKFSMMSRSHKEVDLMRANFDYRDLGFNVGKGTDEDAEYDRLIEFLKSGGIISRAAFLGIMRSATARDRIIRAMGVQYYQENFVDKEYDVRFSSDKLVNLNPVVGHKKGQYKTGKVADLLKKQIRGEIRNNYPKGSKSNKK